MALILVNKQTTTLKTTSTENSRSNLRTIVANSKGTEWMVSSYNQWQERAPLANTPIRNTSFRMRLVSRLTLKERSLNPVMSYSFRAMVLMIGLMISDKVR